MPKSNVEFLRMGVKGRPVGVDRERAVINGFVVAQLGVFKDERGEFIEESLASIRDLGNAAKQGLRSRFAHPNECNGGSLGNFLGRARDFFLSETVNAEGLTVPAVRADLHLDKTALEDSPNGGTPRGLYLMNLIESDSAAISSSLVLRANKERRKNPDGSLMLDSAGDPVPPIWRPTHLAAADVVDEGAAVDGILGVGGLDKEYLWQATDMLDGLFPDMTREQVAERLTGFLGRYLDLRFGEAEPTTDEKTLAIQKRISELQDEVVGNSKAIIAALQTEPDLSGEIELRLRRNRARLRAA